MKYTVFFLMLLLFGTACKRPALLNYQIGATLDAMHVQATLQFSLAHSQSQSHKLKDELSEYYLLVADTGQSLQILQQGLQVLQQQTGLSANQVDSLQIPYRLHAAEYLALEPLYAYGITFPEKTIALTTGLYVLRSQAESRMAQIRPFAPKCFIVPTVLYTGCTTKPTE
jgi:hypothetical protein